MQTISLGATTSQSINPTWQVSIPSTFVLDSNIQLRLPFRFKFKGTTDATKTRCLPDGQWCMSRYSIYQAIQSITVSLDGATLTKSIGEIMPLISDYTDLEDARSHDLYSCPDTVQSFANLYASQGASQAAILATSATPFASAAFAHSKYGSRMPVVMNDINANRVGPAGSMATAGGDPHEALAGEREVNYDIDVYMALPWSIFASSGNGLGLNNLRMMRVSLQFNSEWNRMFNYLPDLTGYANDTGPACVGAVFSDVPQLMCRFVKPPDFVTDALVDPATKLPYTQFHTMKQHTHWYTSKAIASGATEVMSTTPITLSAIPKRIFVAAVRARSTKNGLTPYRVLSSPSTYGLLSDVKITIGGQSASNYLTPFGLYEMSTRNGYSLPWSIARQSGFAVCFDLQNDLSLGRENFLSSMSNLPLSVSANVKDLVADGADVAYDFVVVVETDSFLEFTPNGIVKVTDALELSADDKQKLSIIGKHIVKNTSNTIGGSIFGTIFRGAKKVLSGLPKLAWDNRGKIFDYVKSSLASGFRPNSVGGSDAIVPAKKPSAASKRGAGVAQSTEDCRIL